MAAGAPGGAVGTLVIVGARFRSIRLFEGVHWVGRLTDRRQLAGLHDQASVFVLPSHFEPMG